ncbi:MAG: hypothetical protein Q9181_004486 [Wetmoreana brouardii]
MGRPDPADYADERPRRRGRKEEAFEDEPEDDPEYSEPDERPRRHKGGKQPKPRYMADEEDEDDVEDSHYSKQMVIHKGKKKARSSGKEVARRRKDESSEEEESSEEDRKPKKKGKKKNARADEVITKKAWEECPEDDIDAAFIDHVADTLEVSPNKVWKHAAKCLVRHTETGEYDIQKYFDKDIFPRKDMKKWNKHVEQLKQDRIKSKKDILYCTTITGDGNFGRSVYGGRPPRTAFAREPAMVPMGHSRFEYNCFDCIDANAPCGDRVLVGEAGRASVRVKIWSLRNGAQNEQLLSLAP